jgi:hypothetical protein
LCARLGVEHLNLGLRVHDWPPQHRVRQLVDAVETMGRPLLVHCLDGHDRSGWAAASVRLLAGHELDDALAELSPLKGHLCRRSQCYLHRFFEQYRRWLGERQERHSAERFRRWASAVYAPDPYHAELTLTGELPSEVPAGETVRLGVQVTNRGRTAWSSSAPGHGVRLGARLVGPVAAPLTDPVESFRRPGGPAQDVARAEIPRGLIAPGERQELELVIRLEVEPGSYLLQVDMVEEGVHWFSDVGPPGVIVALEVVAPRR